jgi:nucleotide-binding universal stress UspA family protein
MNDFLNRILVATDGSEDAELAIRAAVDLADGTGSELHVVHAWRRVLPAATYSPAVDDDSRVYEQHAMELLDEQVKLVENKGGTVVAAHLREGRSADAIAGLAEEFDVDLLVLGSRGLGAVERLITGSVSEGVVHLATCPTLMMRGGEGAWPPSRIVVGDDSSEEAERAGRLAVNIGRLFGRRALLVRVYPPQTAYRATRVFNADMTPKPLEELDESLKRRAVQLAWRRDVRREEMRPKIKAATGDPAAVLQKVADESEGTTLVAVGSRGLGAVRRFALGSVSTDVLRAVDGPILIVPPPKRESR